MKTQNYKLSFTAASLSINESVNIAEVYTNCRDWNEVKRIIRGDNLLQSRTNSRTTRVLAELIPRLKLLSNDQLSLLVEGSLTEQKYLLWFTVCRTYDLIKEFAVEVLHEKYLSRNMKVTDLDYDAFFNRKADWNDDLDNITTLTRKKIRQVVFHMMREAELLTDDNTILRAMLSSRLIEVLKPDAPMSFEIFPVEPV